jgi:hypothetical protein
MKYHTLIHKYVKFAGMLRFGSNQIDTYSILRKNTFFLLTLLLFFALIRNGLTIYGTAVRNALDQKNFVYDTWPGSYTLQAFNQFIFHHGLTGLILLYVTIFLAFACLLVWELQPYDKIRILVLVMILLLPGTTIIFQRLGSPDTLPILCGVLGALSRSRVRAIVYAIISVGVHPEAAIISGVSLFIILKLGQSTWTYSNEKSVKYFASTMVIIGLIVISYSNFFIQSPNSRIQVSTSTYIKYAIAQNLASSYWIIFAWFGTLWVIVYARWNELRGIEKRYFTVLITIVGGVSLAASDGTRVAAILLTAMTVLLFSPFNSSYIFRIVSPRWLIVMYLVPPMNISNFNVFLPFHQVLYFFDIAKLYLVTNF